MRAAAIKGKTADVTQMARNANATEKKLGQIAKETDKEALDVAKLREKDAVQEARNIKARDKYTDTITKAREAADLEDKARMTAAQTQQQMAGVKPETVVRKSAKTVDPNTGQEVTVTQTQKRGRGRGKSGAPVPPPTAPVAPSAAFQIVRKDGKGPIIETATEAEALAEINKLGPDFMVVPPTGYKAAAPAPTSKVKGTATEILEKAPKAPEPFNPPKIVPAAVKKAAAPAADIGSPVTPGVPTVTSVAQKEVEAMKQADLAAREARGAAPIAQLPEPLAKAVAERSALPQADQGQEWARFFRNLRIGI